MPSSIRTPAGSISEQHLAVDPKRAPLLPKWETGAAIDLKTSALSIMLMPLLRVTARPIRTSTNCRSSTEGEWFTIPSDMVMFDCHTVRDMALYSITPNETEAFTLLDRRAWRAYILFLNRVGTAGCYRLAKCCPCYELQLVKATLLYRPPQRTNLDFTNVFGTLHSVLTQVTRDIGDLDQLVTGILPWKNSKEKSLALLRGCSLPARYFVRGQDHESEYEMVLRGPRDGAHWVRCCDLSPIDTFIGVRMKKITIV